MAIRRPTRRTKIVWASFGSAMTLVTGLLILAEGNADGGSDVGVPRAFVAAAPAGVEMSAGPLEPRDAAFDASRWTSIVIHHTGSPAGDPETIERQHVSNGYASLGYHFVIGNGHGFGDGAVFVGPRWNRQEPGAHVAGANGARLNEHAIGICLVGFCYGGYLAVMPTLAADYFGQKNIGANYGLLFSAWGAAGFIVPGYLSGIIEQARQAGNIAQGYDQVFYWLAGIAGVAAGMALIARRPASER